MRKNFPFYTQHDNMQYGITCLQMICKYYGKEYSLESLSRYCFACLLYTSPSPRDTR